MLRLRTLAAAGRKVAVAPRASCAALTTTEAPAAADAPRARAAAAASAGGAPVRVPGIGAALSGPRAYTARAAHSAAASSPAGFAAASEETMKLTGPPESRGARAIMNQLREQQRRTVGGAVARIVPGVVVPVLPRAHAYTVHRLLHGTSSAAVGRASTGGGKEKKAASVKQEEAYEAEMILNRLQQFIKELKAGLAELEYEMNRCMVIQVVLALLVVLVMMGAAAVVYLI